MNLFGVVGEQFLEVAFKDRDLGDDPVCCGDPLERLGIVVPRFDITGDYAGELAYGTERPAPDSLAGDDSEPGFYLVDPGTADGVK